MGGYEKTRTWDNAPTRREEKGKWEAMERPELGIMNIIRGEEKEKWEAMERPELGIMNTTREEEKEKREAMERDWLECCCNREYFVV